MAQEKEMLKDSIGRLIESVDELKLDNAALTNSLTLVSTSNQQFRQHTIVGVLPGIHTAYTADFQDDFQFE